MKSSLSAKAREALDHYNKALDYLKQNNWAGYGKELQDMKAILSEMSANSTVDLRAPGIRGKVNPPATPLIIHRNFFWQIHDRLVQDRVDSRGIHREPAVEKQGLKPDRSMDRIQAFPGFSLTRVPRYAVRALKPRTANSLNTSLAFRSMRPHAQNIRRHRAMMPGVCLSIRHSIGTSFPFWRNI